VQSGAQPSVTVVVPTTTLAVNSTVTSPATIISSIETPTAVGTLIRNTQSNVTIQTERTIHIAVSGVLSQVHQIARGTVLAHSIRSSLH
jgi:hypothetical protein